MATPIEKRFLGTDELSQYLNLSINTIRSWIWQKKIPYCKMGRLVRFDLKEIEVWLKEHKIEEMS